MGTYFNIIELDMEENVQAGVEGDAVGAVAATAWTTASRTALISTSRTTVSDDRFHDADCAHLLDWLGECGEVKMEDVCIPKNRGRGQPPMTSLKKS